MRRSIRWMGATALATTALAFACSTNDPQPNNGDRLIVDVPIPPPLPPQPESDSGAGDPYAKPDAAAAREICDTCACPTDTFCLGAMTMSTFGGVCALDGSALGVGCNSVPAACKDTPTCPCILSAIGNIGCYPVCSPSSSDAGDSFFIYCPSP